jgi:hypothetical protein
MKLIAIILIISFNTFALDENGKKGPLAKRSSRGANAEDLGKMFKSNKGIWIDILNNRATYFEGATFPSKRKRCRINEDQELRIVSESKDNVLLRLIGPPANCPNKVLFSITKKKLSISFRLINNPKQSIFCSLDSGEQYFIDSLNDSKIVYGKDLSYSTIKMRTVSQCSRNVVKLPTVDSSREVRKERVVQPSPVYSSPAQVIPD